MGLLSYINGARKGRAAHDLEREAMQDAFLADALDGYDRVDDPELNERLYRMEMRIRVYLLSSEYPSDYVAAASLPSSPSPPEVLHHRSLHPSLSMDERPQPRSMQCCIEPEAEQRMDLYDTPRRSKKRRWIYWILAAVVLLCVIAYWVFS